MQQIGHRIFAVWFTYDTQGQPTWMTLSGQLQNNELEGELIRHTGPALGSIWDVTQVEGTAVGHATLKLNPTRRVLQFDYQVDSIQGQLNLQPFYPDPANQYDGFWWQPDSSGLGIQIYHKGDYLFGCAYLYDKSGQSFWVTFQGQLIGKQFRARLQRFTGPRLGDSWDVNQVSAKDVGEIKLTLMGTDQSQQTDNAASETLNLIQSEVRFIEMDYTLNGKDMHLDLQRFRF